MFYRGASLITTRALLQAMAVGLYTPETFDKNEYVYYDSLGGFSD